MVLDRRNPGDLGRERRIYRESDRAGERILPQGGAVQPPVQRSLPTDARLLVGARVRRDDEDLPKRILRGVPGRRRSRNRRPANPGRARGPADQAREDKVRSASGGGMSPAAVRNLCIMPALGLLIAFNVFPLLASFGISFTDFNPIIDTAPVFNGAENYRELLASPRQEVWRSFTRTGALVLVTVGLQTLIGFAVAMLLSRNFRGRGLFTAVLLIPMMLSPAVMGSFWRYLFNADY